MYIIRKLKINIFHCNLWLYMYCKLICFGSYIIVSYQFESQKKVYFCLVSNLLYSLMWSISRLTMEYINLFIPTDCFRSFQNNEWKSPLQLRSVKSVKSVKMSAWMADKFIDYNINTFIGNLSDHCVHGVGVGEL